MHKLNLPFFLDRSVRLRMHIISSSPDHWSAERFSAEDSLVESLYVCPLLMISYINLVYVIMQMFFFFFLLLMGIRSFRELIK